MHASDRKAAAPSRCPETRALLSSYVEGELSGAEQARVAGHLHICAMAACLLLVVGVTAAPLARMLTGSGPARTNPAAQPAPAEVPQAVQPPTHRDVAAGGAPPMAPPKPFEAAGPTIPMEEHSTPSTNVSPPFTHIERTPKQVVVARSPRLHAYRRGAARRDVPAQPPTDQDAFLAVRPKEGPSAAETLREAQPTVASRGSSEPRPVRDEPLIPDRHERVQVGEGFTEIRTAHRIDSEGRRTGIDVNIATAHPAQTENQ